MAKQVNIHAAKTHFSKLVEEVKAGGAVIVARVGKPILKFVKIEEKPTLCDGWDLPRTTCKYLTGPPCSDPADSMPAPDRLSMRVALPGSPMPAA
jgi:antitoxin (DNA-binding transcriptional repressor) of toxin-antitoxin stability system